MASPPRRSSALTRGSGTQEKYSVDYRQNWYNEAEAAIAVHREAHGLVAEDIVEVHEGH